MPSINTPEYKKGEAKSYAPVNVKTTSESTCRQLKTLKSDVGQDQAY